MKTSIATTVAFLSLAMALNAYAQPVPHHFSGIGRRADGTLELSLDGSVSNMLNLSVTISNQFMQMSDMYLVESSPDLKVWRPFASLLRTNSPPAFRKISSHAYEEWASHGYVVVAIDHNDCWATEFPDGRYLAASRGGDVPGRLKDMQFLLDELAALNAGDPMFAGRLDLDRIGVYGFSYGGMVVETCRTDGRVKCAVV